MGRNLIHFIGLVSKRLFLAHAVGPILLPTGHVSGGGGGGGNKGEEPV